MPSHWKLPRTVHLLSHTTPHYLAVDHQTYSTPIPDYLNDFMSVPDSMVVADDVPVTLTLWSICCVTTFLRCFSHLLVSGISSVIHRLSFIGSSWPQSSDIYGTSDPRTGRGCERRNEDLSEIEEVGREHGTAEPVAGAPNLKKSSRIVTKPGCEIRKKRWEH
ncbi:hypothetical protein T4B_11802 [Trichinella pseudospiralis]|uniref:Uncharacterized protein n=1 Tax=Trichinella pseudospiralis TaxID=6337 RepID=A0A0V1HKM6_TRIPS|nr:hypothetical protein T4B_11802 [Trichinella pseudospiralis]